MEKANPESEQPLLANSDNSTRGASTPRTPGKVFRLSGMLLIFLLTIFAATVASLRRFSTATDVDLPYSPANAAIQYERKAFWDAVPSSFLDTPSEGTDVAWRRLIDAGLNVKISKEEMVKNGENMTNAVQLEDGSYLGILGVYHQLHCLNNLRMALFAEHYKSKLNEPHQRNIFDTGHLNHCIDSIRKSLMCHADVAMGSAVWIAGSDKEHSKNLRSNAEVKCVNWDAVESWAKERVLETRKFKLRAGPFEKSQTGDV